MVEWQRVWRKAIVSWSLSKRTCRARQRTSRAAGHRVTETSAHTRGCRNASSYARSAVCPRDRKMAGNSMTSMSCGARRPPWATQNAVGTVNPRFPGWPATCPLGKKLLARMLTWYTRLCRNQCLRKPVAGRDRRRPWPPFRENGCP